MTQPFPKQNGRWGNISYVNSQEFSYDLWVTTITQPYSLIGTEQQSRLTKHFYPHGFNLGALTVTGVCQSQEDLQALARFVRTHQQALINQPPDELFIPHQNGISRLLSLAIPTEGIANLGGFIGEFQLSKKGVFDPAPQYTFDFVVILDPHTRDYTLSHALVKWSESALGSTGHNSGANVPSSETSSIPYVDPNSFDSSVGSTWAQIVQAQNKVLDDMLGIPSSEVPIK